MTDKLICPFCGEELSLEFEPCIRTWCINDKCEYAGIKYSIYVHRILKQTAVLQKKLDKAMGFLKNTAAALKHAGNMGALAANFDDVIKEIEDIKE